MKRMGILGRKIGMTQIFTAEGVRIPVTVIEAGPNVVTEIKTMEKHGYSAIQLGFADQKPHRVNKPDMGRFAKLEIAPKKFVKEIRLDPSIKVDYEVGQEIKVDEIFKVGDPIDVTATSKGKGFQGVMKRYNYAGFIASHGTHEYFRHGGSIGNSATPARVVPGIKMPGQMGNKKVTIQNLKVAAIHPEDNLILLQGGVPGPKNGYVTLKFAAKKRIYL